MVSLGGGGLLHDDLCVVDDGTCGGLGRFDLRGSGAAQVEMRAAAVVSHIGLQIDQQHDGDERRRPGQNQQGAQ